MGISKMYASSSHSRYKFRDRRQRQIKSDQLRQESSRDAKIDDASRERFRIRPSLILYPNPTEEVHGRTIHSWLLLIPFLSDVFSMVYQNWSGDLLALPVC